MTAHARAFFLRKQQKIAPGHTLLGMRTRIFCLTPASQCVNSPTEAARARALLTAREARLPTNLRARRKLTFLSVTN